MQQDNFLLPGTLGPFSSGFSTMFEVTWNVPVWSDSSGFRSTCFGVFEVVVVIEISAVAVSSFEVPTELDVISERRFKIFFMTRTNSDRIF